MRFSREKLVALFVMVAVLTVGMPGWAAMKEDREARVAEKLEAIRNWKLMDVLNLSQDRAEKVFMILRPFDLRRRALLQERRRVRRALVRAAEGKTVKGDVRRLARRYLAIGTELAKLREEELRALEKELTPREEAKYLLFMDRFRLEVVRMLIRGRRGPGLQFPRRPMVKGKRAPVSPPQ